MVVAAVEETAVDRGVTQGERIHPKVYLSTINDAPRHMDVTSTVRVTAHDAITSEYIDN